MNHNCKICKTETEILFQKNVLQKYPTNYLSCRECGFLFSDYKYNLNEAYADAIVKKDTGVLFRNLLFAEKAALILNKNFKKATKFLDFAGGYGILTRLMRDKGYNFISYDKFCQNLFSAPFLISNFPEKGQDFDFITALEIFEHLENPMQTIIDLTQHSNAILFTTELIPAHQNLENWHYLSADTGQHISFYAEKTLKVIAEKLGFYLYSDRVSFHLLSKNKIKKPLFLRKNTKFIKAIQFLQLGYNFTKFLPKAHIHFQKDSSFVEKNNN